MRYLVVFLVLSTFSVACISPNIPLQRVQFGSRIDGYGAIQEKIAKMSMIHYATESMAYMVAGTMDAGHQDYHVRS